MTLVSRKPEEKTCNVSFVLASASGSFLHHHDTLHQHTVMTMRLHTRQLAARDGMCAVREITESSSKITLVSRAFLVKHICMKFNKIKVNDG